MPKSSPYGPVIAVYPSEATAAPKNAAETKAALKARVNPADLEIQVSTLRRVGNAGVILRTTTEKAANKIKSAIPPTLWVTEPRSRRLLVALYNIDGGPSEESDPIRSMHRTL